MTFPPTHYDFIKIQHPVVIECAEADALDLLSQPAPPETIGSVDHYESRAEQCLNTTLEMYNRRGPYPDTVMKSLITSLNYEYHCVVNFALSGKKTFYFSNDLCEQLAHTEINLPADQLQLPFPSCMFVYTSETVLRCFHNTIGAEGRRNINLNKVDMTAPITVFLTSRPGPDNERKLVTVSFHSRTPDRAYAMLKREMSLSRANDLEQALRTDWGKSNPPGGEGTIKSIDLNRDTISQTIDDKMFYTDGLMFYRILLNSVLYLTSETKEVSHHETSRAAYIERANRETRAAKRRKILQFSNKFSELAYSLVGESVGKIIVSKAGQSNQEPKSSPSGSKHIGKRFIVRGHWRNQAHGQGMLLKRLIWIRPYFKGPDVAALINKPYLVK